MNDAATTVKPCQRAGQCRSRVALDHDNVRPNSVQHRIQGNEQSAEQLIERLTVPEDAQMVINSEAEIHHEWFKQIGVLRCGDDMALDQWSSSGELPK